MFKKFLFRVTEVSRSTLIVLVGLGLIGLVTCFKLGTLVPNYAAVESQTAQSSRSLKDIWADPTYAPYKFGQYVVQKFKITLPATLRAVSAFYGSLSVVLFYFVVRHWHTKRIALMSTVLFATSSWFLHTARIATPSIMQVMLLALVAYGLWAQLTHKFELSLTVGVIVLAFCLYVPGLVWFWLSLLIWRRKQILQHIIRVSWLWRIYALVILLCALTLLIQGLVRQPWLIRLWFGLPENLPTLATYGRNVIDVPINLFLRASGDPVFWLDHLPVLDVFSAVMFLLGIYAYYFRLRLDRTLALIGIFVIGSLLIGLGGSMTLTILLPFVYLVVAAGLALMLQQWFTVFPRNPLARGLAVGVLTLAVGVTSFYHLMHYFVAWPNAPETRAAFNIAPEMPTK